MVAHVAATPFLGTGSRRQATQDAMQRFADQGITSFVDKSGRRWKHFIRGDGRTYRSGPRSDRRPHAGAGKRRGDLVTASNAPRECPLCRPWEGKVLTISGPDGAHAVEVEHAIEDGRTVRVNVAGSLDAARRAGLQHPNCRHSVSAYTPGITRTDNATPDPAGDEAGQRQRAIERNIRNTRTGPPPLSTPSRSAPRTPRSASGRAPCAST
ncbi:phage minor capsid protein [Streptomyces sp. NBC_01411]|uniref:phage minor capsid protein n=1 Tax=Streptomyces sp. NBC_01411 TaxID=2903857 RepID=UPI0032529BDB|nr:phage minor capsid protein [Streptomyces sp. NBC_00932]